MYISRKIRSGNCICPASVSKYGYRLYSTPSYSNPALTGVSSAKVRSAQDYCSQLLRKYDTPSHTLLAFIPAQSRPAYLAIRALNLEIARIPDTVSTPAVGAMRYQFWRDNVTRAFAGNPPEQPVTLLLSSALADLDARSNGQAKLSKSWFNRIINTREQYGDGRPYPTLDALEKYGENTYSTLLYLTLQTLPLASVAADHVASHVGKAAGIAAVLRGLPLLAFPGPGNHHNSNPSPTGGLDTQQRQKQGIITLPLDVMAKAGVRDEDVLRKGAEAEGLRDAVFEVATRASDHLITAREMVRRVRGGEDVGHAFEHEGEEGHVYGDGGAAGKEKRQGEEVDKAFGVLMPAVATTLWLEKLQQLDFDVFREEVRRRDWRLPFKAYFAYRRGLL